MIINHNPDRVIAAIGFALIFSLAGDLSLYAILPMVAVAAGLSLSGIGVILSANRFIRFISNPIVGYLLDSHRRKKFIVAGLMLGAVATLLYQFYETFWIFLLGRILWGVAFSLSYITAYSMVMDITPEKQRGRSSGLLQTYYLIGLAIMPFLGAILYGWLGFQATMLICSLLGFIGAVEAWIFVPETYLDLESVFPKNDSVHQNNLVQKFSFSTIVREIRSFDVASSNVIYGLTFFVGEGILMSTITYYFLNVFGATLNFGLLVISAATAGGLVLGLRAVTSAILSPLVGKYSDHIANRWIVVSFGLMAGIMGLVIIVNVHTPALFIIGILTFALNGAVVQTIIPAILIDKNVTGQGSLKLGIMATSADIGLALAPIVSYAILGKYNISTLYYGGAAILGISLLVALISIKRENTYFKSNTG
jgi:MFS family permease